MTRIRARPRYVVRIDGGIRTDVEWARDCTIAARCAYFDSLFHLAGIGEPDGLYPHADLVADFGRDADGVAAQLTRFGVWEFAGLGYLVRPYGGCGVVPERRAPIPAEVRAKVFERDEYRCVRCAATEELALDHVYPWSLGGPDTEENLQVLCTPCNSSKGAKI